MSFHDPEWSQQQAGEYVLGTLPDEELHEFIAQLAHDQNLQRLVVEWQEQLQPLALSAEPVRPRVQVWSRLSNQLGLKAIDHSNQPESTFESSRFRKKKTDKKLLAWQWAGSLAMAASAVLAFLLWQTKATEQPSAFDAVSVVSAEDTGALWVVNASIKDNKLRIVAIAPPGIGDKQDHQLWMVKANNGGVTSLGLLPRNANTAIVVDVPELRGDAVALAVSLEPAGGSKQAGPSGPVLYQGQFLRLDNRQGI